MLATLWGWLTGGSLLIGAVIGYFFDLPSKIISSIMAFGSGVLISAVSFDLMDEAFQHGGMLATGVGFFAGSIIYTLLVRIFNKRGAKFRKRSGLLQPTEKSASGSGMAIAIGALLDGIPESIVIGLSLLSGKGVSLVAVFAVFISNIPEGLSSSHGMKHAGRSKKYIFGLWIGMTFISGIASMAGYTIFSGLSKETVAATTGVAAGAILSMIVDTMIPEAYEDEHDLAGVITVVGFLIAFITSKLVD